MTTLPRRPGCELEASSRRIPSIRQSPAGAAAACPIRQTNRNIASLKTGAYPVKNLIAEEEQSIRYRRHVRQTDGTDLLPRLNAGLDETSSVIGKGKGIPVGQ